MGTVGRLMGFFLKPADRTKTDHSCVARSCQIQHLGLGPGKVKGILPVLAGVELPDEEVDLFL